MKILIDTTELQLLLEKKREYIGVKPFDGVDVLFAGTSFLVSSLGSTYGDTTIISGHSIKIICILLGITFCIWGMIKMRKSLETNYDKENLYKDIECLNEITHPFSIAVIKDTFNDYPNRFLLYYDERWKCKFFFNCKTVENDEMNIRAKLSNALKVQNEEITVEFVTEKITRKYSVSDQTDKVYDHKFYFVDFHTFSDNMKEKEFEVDGTKFYWMTLKDMESDEDIIKKNMDIVDVVKEYIP